MKPKPPNVIMLVCDQLRAFDVGCYGHPLVATPNIDRLAARGVRFETAVTNNAVCTPARSTMLSGQYSRTCNGVTGCSGDPGPRRRQFAERTIAEAYRDAGYRTASIGKWHMPSPPASVGFEEWVYPTVRHWHTDRTFIDAARPDGFVARGWSWDYEFERVSSWLDQQGDQPFFLYHNIEPPHMPLDDVPDRYKTLYDPAQVPIRENALIDGALASDEHWFKTYLWDHRYTVHKEPWTDTLPAGFDLRQLTAMYLGLVTLVDDLVGRFVGDLERRGLLENTLLVFTSDHGDNLGSHGCWNKCMLWEESLRVPMIWHWPAALAPRTVDRQIASLVDLAPTLLGLSGIDAPALMQGCDLAPVIRGESVTTGENVAYVESIKDGVGIRTLDHLYSIELADPSLYQHAPENDRIIDPARAFYDLRQDPCQLRNLAGSPEQAAVAEGLRERLTAWHAKTPWLDPEVLQPA